MPYISKKLRRLLTREGGTAVTGGELNYVISRVVDHFIETNGLNYARITDVRGALIGCLSEFDRKISWPYEDLKCRENGEVFTASLEALEDAKHPEVRR